jgi:hypothetical protein
MEAQMPSEKASDEADAAAEADSTD